MKRVITKALKWTSIALGILLITVVCCNSWIISSTKAKVFSSIDSLPYNKVGLVLGANKKGKAGGPNLYFNYRIAAAVSLYKAQKISHIIVSGDNHIKEYDEATDMQQALIALGIPDTAITLDYAGFRTLDSVVRCKKIFGQQKFTIISQQFHNEGALFISDYYGIDAVAFNAKDVSKKYSYKTTVREYFSRFKAVLDLYILKTAPKFLGEPVAI